MTNIWEKAIFILAGNLNSGLSCFNTTVILNKFGLDWLSLAKCVQSQTRFYKFRLIWKQFSTSLDALYAHKMGSLEKIHCCI